MIDTGTLSSRRAEIKNYRSTPPGWRSWERWDAGKFDRRQYRSAAVLACRLAIRRNAIGLAIAYSSVMTRTITALVLALSIIGASAQRSANAMRQPSMRHVIRGAISVVERSFTSPIETPAEEIMDGDDDCDGGSAARSMTAMLGAIPEHSISNPPAISQSLVSLQSRAPPATATSRR